MIGRARDSLHRWVPLLVFLLAGGAHAVSLGLQPSTQNAAPGDAVSVDLVISGLAAGGPDSLGDFEIDVAFDPTALSLDGFSVGSDLGDLALGQALDFSLGDLGGGVVNLSVVSLLEADAASCVFCTGPYLDEIQPDSFVLATLDFRVDTLAVGDRTTISVLNVYALGDGFGVPLPLDGTSDAVVANAVPEPGAALVFATGLLLASGAVRRRGRSPTR